MSAKLDHVETKDMVPLAGPDVLAVLDEGHEGWRERLTDGKHRGGGKDKAAVPDSYKEAAFRMVAERMKMAGLSSLPKGYSMEVGQVLGICPATIRKWASREKWEARLLRGANTRPTGRLYAMRVENGETLAAGLEDAADNAVAAIMQQPGAMEKMLPEVVKKAENSLQMRVQQAQEKVVDVLTRGVSHAAEALDATSGKVLKEQADRAAAGEDVDEAATLRSMNSMEKLADLNKKSMPGTGNSTVVSAQNALIQITGPQGSL